MVAGGEVIDLVDFPRSRVFVGDWNNDSLMDILIGALDGRIYLALAESANGPQGEQWIIGLPGEPFTYVFAPPPVVTVDTLLTYDSTPELTGTVDDPDAAIEVTVDGNNYTAMNNGDGTWTLADDIISPVLPYGTYDVIASATNLAGNVGMDSTLDELIISIPYIIHVDDDATAGANNGLSWDDAFIYLQDALDFAEASGGQVGEIWVAQGIYKPDQGVAVVSGDRYATFQLLNGVAVIGGYAGLGEPDPNARDVVLYETVLSGDLNGDDLEVDPSELLFEPTRAENSYHVVTASLTIASAVLDGFTITGGNATSDGPYSGGGIFNRNPPTPEWECTFEGPTIINCTIYRNSAAGEGGGMYNQYSCQPQIINCTFSENMAGWGGGGIKNDTSSPNITNCDFENNFVGLDGYEHGGGGAIDNEESSPICIDCTFIANSALNYGGAISNWMGNCSPKFVNCIFSMNSAEYGGVMWTSNFHEIGSGSHPEFINCTLAGNSAVYGNALACTEGPFGAIPSDFNLTNCILWNGGNEIYISDGSTITISYSDIQGGWSGDGNIDVDPLFVDPVNGNYNLLPGSPCIDAGDNSAVPVGITTDLDGNPRFCDDPDTIDTGNGIAPIVDMGAYESWPVIFVDVDAAGANDGSSWINAFSYLQDGLAVAISGRDIWVAQGIYKPDQGAAVVSGDRYASFQLLNGVTVIGGFAGLGEPDPNERDVVLYETILSGDLNGDDGSGFVNYGENSYHVVTGSGTDTTAVLAGFTITSGNATGSIAFSNDSGAGVYCLGGSPVLIDNTFSANLAMRGGGIFTYSSNSILFNCTFSDNFAVSDGGGMYNILSSPTIIGSTFNGNYAGEFGGGMCNFYYSSPTLMNTIFTGNVAKYGGGMANILYSSPTLTNCAFIVNVAIYLGGGMCDLYDSNPTLIDCIFIGNIVIYSGGGMHNQTHSSPDLANCIFNGNFANNLSGGVSNFQNSSPTLTNNTCSGNSVQYGGGIFNYLSSNPTLTNSTFSGNFTALYILVECSTLVAT
jgi:hypothetical protein